MTEPFWSFDLHSRAHNSGSFGVFGSSDRDDPFESSHVFVFTAELHETQQLGQFFLQYAYSTPAGVAYRLTYGIGKD